MRIRCQRKQVASGFFWWPKRNRSFLDLLEEDRNDKVLRQFVHIRTCGLRTSHISMKHRWKTSDWNFKKLLSSLHRILDESLSRRTSYEALKQAVSSDYPMQFCAHCLVENKRVAVRATEIWPKIVEIIDFRNSLPKSKRPGKWRIGANTSYDHLCSIQKHPPVPLKLQFFEDIVRTFFLVLYRQISKWSLFLQRVLRHILSHSVQSLSGKMCLRVVKQSVYW